MIDRILAGRYKIVAPIGEGGMSRVWRAQDLNTGKSVAVKVLRDEFKEDETFVRRFEREAQAASRMSHPNIANLLDVGLEEDGTRYLVIEYVQGKTLKQFIQESENIRPETAAHIIIRVLAAVQHAHQNGVIHRDIKPQNILIDKEGSVKVSDFGIARLANSQTMNQENETVMGSVYYYFSPEQAKGEKVDEKSDIYSVGAVFYELLTGKVPFTGDTPVAIAMQHINDVPVAPSKLNDAVSPALEFVVMHALEKRPRHRYASASEMLRDVRLALEHPDTILAAREEDERRKREQRADERRREQQEKRTAWTRRIVVGGFAFLLLLITAFAGYTIMSNILKARANNVEVPNVIGRQSDEAINILMEVGIDPVIAHKDYELIQENIVGDQSIAPGTIVQRGEKMTITICRSNYEVRVPSLTNIPLEDAQTIASNAGLVVGPINRLASQAQPGLVIEQSLPSGSAANQGDEIILTVSGGSVTMPRLVDLTRGQAEQTIDAYKLLLTATTDVQVTDPSKVGRVISQSPEPFVTIMPNHSVQLEIGIASTELLRASITLDLSGMADETTVTVLVPDESGERVVQYTRFFDETQDEVNITIYSKTAREGTYIVQFDDTEQYTKEVTFGT